MKAAFENQSYSTSSLLTCGLLVSRELIFICNLIFFTSFKHVFPLHKQHYLTGSPFGKCDDPPDPSVTSQSLLLKARIPHAWACKSWWKNLFNHPSNLGIRFCLFISWKMKL